jgi:hypothetical protein
MVVCFNIARSLLQAYSLDCGPRPVGLARCSRRPRSTSRLIDPGKPWQNATDESFNGKQRDECLSVQWFRKRLDARVSIEQWR